jgi:probable rRNA maturation factor
MSSIAESLGVEVYLEDYFFGGLSAEKLKTLGNNNADLPISVEIWENWFGCWLENLVPLVMPSRSGTALAYELSLRLTHNAEIQALNAQYRHKDQPTDVLAFAALEVNSPQIEEINEPLYLGDIIISVETAFAQAKRHSLKQELAWLAAHALLHLLGWDHPTEAELLAMLQKQSRLLEQVGVEPPEYRVENITD